jgi:hypothetical protein
LRGLGLPAFKRFDRVLEVRYLGQDMQQHRPLGGERFLRAAASSITVWALASSSIRPFHSSVVLLQLAAVVL